MSLWSIVLLGACFCVAAQQAHAGAKPLLETDFTSDPLQDGWTQVGPGGHAFAGRWVAGESPDHITVSQGWWESPSLPVKPFAYYDLKFRFKTSEKGYVAAIFLDSEGKALQSDTYDSLYPAPDWQDQELCFRAYPLAVKVQIRFQAITTPVDVARVSLHQGDTIGTARWAESVMAADPPLHYTPPTDLAAQLPRTAAALRHGRSLRIVLLGDSIANDTGCSLFETLLHHRFPHCRVEVVNSTRGGTSCIWYQHENRVESYVLQFHPDLLIIAGISHGYDSEAIRSVIRQVRAISNPEIMVLSDVITPQTLMESSFVRDSHLPEAEALERIRSYPEGLAQMTREEKVALLDIRTPWNAYIQSSPQPQDWFMRDAIHASSRGKQVVGHMLAMALEKVAG
jgi:hypothetical protein